MPRLDLLGAGIATTLVNVGMCAVAVWVCYARHPFKKFRVLGRFWRADWRLLGQLFVIGFPISVGFMLEWGLFSSAAILVGWIGTTALAATLVGITTLAFAQAERHVKADFTPFASNGIAGIDLELALGQGELAARASRWK